MQYDSYDEIRSVGFHTSLPHAQTDESRQEKGDVHVHLMDRDSCALKKTNLDTMEDNGTTPCVFKNES